VSQARVEWLPNDLEAYCFLKRHLPCGYHVQAEPRAVYFSEWHYCYRVYREGELVAELSGDFRELEPGALAAQAMALLERARHP
jgi:hypothetical protein